MVKHFFSHLIELDTLHVHLDDMDIEEHEREELRELVESNMYHAVLDAILLELSEEDKRALLQLVVEGEEEKVWELLNNKIDNIEEKIKKTAEDIKKILHKDISGVKSKRS